MRKFATILLFIAVIAVISSLLGQQAWSSDGIEEIKKRGYLLWGSDAEGGAPYVFPDPKNPSRLIGFEVEIGSPEDIFTNPKAERTKTFLSRVLKR